MSRISRHVSLPNIDEAFSWADLLRREPVLRLDRVSKRAGRKPVLGDLSAEFARGELVFISGKRGSGKTTLARLLVGQTFPEHGSLWRATPAPPPVGLAWGFESKAPVMVGLELRAASFGLSVRAYVAAVARYMDDPALLNAPLSRFDRRNRALMLFAACYLTPAAIFVADGSPLPAEKAIRDRLAPLFEAARRRAAVIWIADADAKARAHDPDRVLTLEGGVLREVTGF